MDQAFLSLLFLYSLLIIVAKTRRAAVARSQRKAVKTPEGSCVYKNSFLEKRCHTRMAMQPFFFYRLFQRKCWALACGLPVLLGSQWFFSLLCRVRPARCRTICSCEVLRRNQCVTRTEYFYRFCPWKRTDFSRKLFLNLGNPFVKWLSKFHLSVYFCFKFSQFFICFCYKIEFLRRLNFNLTRTATSHSLVMAVMWFCLEKLYASCF